VVDRQLVLTDREKQRFLKTMRAAEGFSGVQVLTHAVLDNHWHILLHVPQRREVDDGEFVSRLGCLYESVQVRSISAELQRLRGQGLTEAADRLKARYTYRMYELSEFVKTLKQRYTQGYNRRHQRRGTLWEERFKSLVLQPPGPGGHNAVRAVAAYIDLNAVRAGIVGDPKEYRFCGYGEAMGGSRRARRGLSAVLDGGGWQNTAREYRKMLYVAGEARGIDQAGRIKKPGFDPQQVRAVLEAGGTLPMNTLLRCRVRYFTDGLVLGTHGYVEQMLRRFRDRFGAKRKRAARPMRHLDGGALCTARQLRMDAISVPAGG
jgi:hypothetical protein